METEREDYRQWTKRNVADRDATLVLNEGRLDGGTALTVTFAIRLSRPHPLLDLEEIRDWLAPRCRFAQRLALHRVAVLNVVGSSERKQPGIHARASAALERLLVPV